MKQQVIRVAVSASAVVVALGGCYGPRGHHHEDEEAGGAAASTATGGRISGGGGASVGGASSTGGTIGTGAVTSTTGGTVSIGGRIGVAGAVSMGGYNTGGVAGTGGVPADVCAVAAMPSNSSITSVDGTSSTFTGGGYYIYADSFGGSTTPNATNGQITPVEGGYFGNALHFTGTGFPESSWGAGVGVWLSCVDASIYDGVGFYYKSDQALQISVSIPATQAVMYGGTCTATACTNNSTSVEASENWIQVAILWDGFVGGSAPMDPTGITGIDIQIPAPIGGVSPWGFEVWLDEFAWHY